MIFSQIRYEVDAGTLSRRQKTLLVEISCQPGSDPLHLLVDSTGIKAVGDGEWCARKHGPSKRRQWRKVHLGVDARTLDIRAIEVTGSRVGPILLRSPCLMIGIRQPPFLCSFRHLN